MTRYEQVHPDLVYWWFAVLDMRQPWLVIDSNALCAAARNAGSADGRRVAV